MRLSQQDRSHCLDLVPPERKMSLLRNCLSPVFTECEIGMTYHTPPPAGQVSLTKSLPCQPWGRLFLLRLQMLHTDTKNFLAGRPCRTAPGKAPGVASQFATRHSFTTPHEASFPVKTPRLGTPGHLSRMGELPSKAGITSDRSEWTRLPNSPGFYNSDKVLRSPPRTVFGRVSCNYICVT